MHLFLIDFNVISVFFIWVQLSEAFTVYVIDKKGHVAEVQQPIHIDADQISEQLRARLLGQLKSANKFKKIRSKGEIRTTPELHEVRRDGSPIVFSDRRYSLNLDRFKPDKSDFDLAGSFSEYYDYINQITSTSQRKESLPNTEIKSRKYIKRKGTRDSIESFENNDIQSKNKRNRFVKRFKIVDNSKKSKKKKKTYKSSESDNSSYEEEKKKHKKKKKKPKYSSDSNKSFKSEEIDQSIEKKPKKKFSSEEYERSDDDEVYLQGNTLINFKKNDEPYDKTKRSVLDSRRRLPNFLPKRYHWTPREMQHLGYFWFNGPKGKYPSDRPLKHG